LKEKLATSESAFLYPLGIFITEVFHDFLAKRVWIRETVRSSRLFSQSENVEARFFASNELLVIIGAPGSSEKRN